MAISRVILGASLSQARDHDDRDPAPDVPESVDEADVPEQMVAKLFKI